MKVRHIVYSYNTPILRFNPRTREGATFYHCQVLLSNFVSIHAPVKVRPLVGDNDYLLVGFNPRTREGATNWYYL